MVIVLNVIFNPQDKIDWARVDFNENAEYALGPDALALEPDLIIKQVARKYRLPEVGFNSDRYAVTKHARTIRIAPKEKKIDG